MKNINLSLTQEESHQMSEIFEKCGIMCRNLRKKLEKEQRRRANLKKEIKKWETEIREEENRRMRFEKWEWVEIKKWETEIREEEKK